WKDALELPDDKSRSDAETRQRLRELFERLRRNYGPALEYYHRHLEILLSFVGWARISRKEKNEYLRLLHAQLSEEELFVYAAYRDDPDAGQRLRELLEDLKKANLHMDFLEKAQ